MLEIRSVQARARFEGACQPQTVWLPRMRMRGEAGDAKGGPGCKIRGDAEGVWPGTHPGPAPDANNHRSKEGQA